MGEGIRRFPTPLGSRLYGYDEDKSGDDRGLGMVGEVWESGVCYGLGRHLGQEIENGDFTGYVAGDAA